MNVNFKFYVAIWMVVAGMTIVLGLYRKLLTKGHFTVLHVRRSELSLIPGEVAYAQRLERIDRWGKILTVTTLVYGFAMAMAYLYLGVQTAA